ncbi:TRAP transporter small permease [Bacillus salacetis]|uniref:TRAP transporter small permease n=1 Tax=Bacillus salacetis TaxID=2315464 RepID=A0A3A1QS96_9BACI|nr:TRAP transporter small permease [Bacillus salacetis]RIW28604.1 TRAP transporter small permease [Bacillus salacetis]
MDTLVRIGRALEKLIVFLVLILMAVLISAVFMQVVLRYVFAGGMVWAEELDRYIFVWLMFLGITMGIYKQKHIAITFITDRMGRFSNAMRILINLITAAFFAVLFWQGLQFMLVSMSGMASVLPVKLGIIYSIIPVSSLLALIFLVIIIIGQKGEKV